MQAVLALSEEYYHTQLVNLRATGVTDVEFLVAQYDAEIRAVDDQVARLLATLDRLRLSERTLVVLVSDHGEAFGEGALYFDHHGLYDAVVRTAMMMRLPDQIGAGTQVDEMVAGYDLMPTILDLLDVPHSSLPYELTGVSLAPLMAGEKGAVHDHLFLTEAYRQGSYAVRTPEWKLIVPVTHASDGTPLGDNYGRPRDGRHLLYDLVTDPTETNDVLDAYPEIARELEERLILWQQTESRYPGQDPVASQTSPRAYQEAVEKMLERAGQKGKAAAAREMVRYARLPRAIREAAQLLPHGARVLVVSKGDQALVDVDGWDAWHFPRGEGGGYAGYYPADSAEAIAHLEGLRVQGAQYLVFPRTSFWWLDHYPEFRVHLEQRYPRLPVPGDACHVFSLTSREDDPRGAEIVARTGSGLL
jgi:hypothetical protein